MSRRMMWAPFVGLLYREVRRFLRVFFQTVMTPLINSTLYLLIFGVSLGEAIPLPEDMNYLAFLIPGLVMMSALNNSFQNTSGSIVTAKFCGELEDLRASPLSAQQIIWALSSAGVIRGFLVGFITLMVGQVFHLQMVGSFLWPQHWGALFFFLLIGSLSFSQLGVWLGFWARTFDQLSGVGAFILLPLMYLGGVFFSLQHLHPFWQGLSKINPVLYLINGVRYGMLGYSDVSVLQSAAVALMGLLVVHSLGWRSVKKGHFERW